MLGTSIPIYPTLPWYQPSNRVSPSLPTLPGVVCLQLPQKPPWKLTGWNPNIWGGYLEKGDIFKFHVRFFGGVIETKLLNRWWFQWFFWGKVAFCKTGRNAKKSVLIECNLHHNFWRSKCLGGLASPFKKKAIYPAPLYTVTNNEKYTWPLERFSTRYDGY